MGKPYRPSNGSDGACFEARWCKNCSREDVRTGKYCEILTATLVVMSVDDPDYPKEWIYDDQGNPTCTAFEKRKA